MMQAYSCRRNSDIHNFDVHRAVHRDIISIVKPTWCTNVPNSFYFGKNFYMFRRSFRPSSGVQDCTYSNRHLSNRYRCMYSLELLMMDEKTVFPSIIRNSRLYIKQQTFVKQILLYVQPWTLDDRRKDRSKHVVSFQNKINTSVIHWCI